MQQKIELLAPAKDIEIGMATIRHGADAVYIGGESFGARFVASNSFEDIEKLVKYAHQYQAKIFLTLNTLLYDEEILPAQKMAFRAYDIGVDALIIQDFGLIEAGLPPMPIHASTQMHNFSVERINFLEKIGFSRVVLPREMSLEKIQEIRNNTNIDLEYFIHGALCVSYSGQCYMSACNGGRSANKGSCAQPCRLPYDVLDKNMQIIDENKYILSLKDLNLENNLDKIIESGISSLKIEGRLKSLPYVKNIVGHYRQLLDRFLEGNSNYKKTSSGSVSLSFTPNPNKTFNRSYTELNINGRSAEIATINSPKSLGAFLGKVISVGQNYIEIDTQETILNGDGLCFVDKKGNLEGFVVNKVNFSHIYADSFSNCFVGAKIFRNKDVDFGRQLNSERTQRTISVVIQFEFKEQINITATDEDGFSVCLTFYEKYENAVQTEKAKQNIIEQFSKSGNTIFLLHKLIFLSELIPFIRIADLNKIRRDVLEQLLIKRTSFKSEDSILLINNDIKYPEKQSTPELNIINSYSKSFFEKHGVEVDIMGAEFNQDYKNLALMTTHHCLKFAYGKCKQFSESLLSQVNDPMFIRHLDNVYKLEFDCKKCVMQIYKQDNFKNCKIID